MSDPGPGHARFDELAAGYALHALEPGDEQQFLSHAGHCPVCQQSLASYADVAAALAEAAPPAEPSPDLGARILAAARADQDRGPAGVPAAGADAAAPAPGAPRPRVVPLHGRRRLQAAAAAAAVVIAGAGIWGGLAATSGAPQPPLAACGHSRQCSEVLLTSAAGHRTAAKVVVSAGSVWLLPASLPADNTARQVYVLWQITGAHAPLAVGSFDIRGGTSSPIRIGALAASYHNTWAFAVSLERGRTIPARPSRLVALGQVSS
jgi:anti-sigma-K factor RskA